MASKKQHYVPQFLLRQFAVPGSGNQIAVYRITADQFIPQTSIRDQAHENYFYGIPQVDEGLTDLESKAAPIITEVLKKHELPPYLSNGYHILQMFTLLQAYRTRQAADERNEYSDKFFKSTCPANHVLDIMSRLEARL